jgi:Zn-dependent metalloprotease
MRKNKQLNVRSVTAGNTVQPPMSFYTNAVARIAKSGTPVEATYSRDGRVRTLMSGSATGLVSLPFAGNPLAHAKSFLAQPSIEQALGLRNVSLVDGKTDNFNFGGTQLSRVEMQQVVRIGDQDIPVRGGYVHVSMDGAGKVLNVTNTVKFGRRPAALPKVMLTGDQAVEVAQKKLGVDSAVGTSRLVLSEHEGKFGLVYEVKLVSQEPRHAMFYLVLAKSGEIVYEQSLIRTSVASPIQNAVNRIPVKCFLAIPDAKKSIPSQVQDHFIESLPDPKVLKDHRFILFVKEGGKWIEVKAKDDGSFSFDSEKESSKFSAVVTYVALRAQYEFLESLGMKKQDRPIKVFIDDPDVQDNAYFDPENYEIHMGVGSGGSWGLTKHIAFDLGVEWHENGHHVVFLQCPGKDLPGDEGGAMHESTGDVLGQLVMQYLWGALYGKQIGNELTLAKIQADQRIIGAFAMPPNGIRKQRNKKSAKRKTGEVHDDGEISGAAHADLLEAIIVDTVNGGGSIQDGVTTFSKLYLAALALVPAHTVRFVDMLRAMETADATLLSGKYKAMIVKAHADHDIVASAGKVGGSTDITIDIDTESDDAQSLVGKTGGSRKGRKAKAKSRSRRKAS